MNSWRCFLANCEKNTKLRDENLLNVCGRRDAKECKSERSLQEFSNKYLYIVFANVGIDTGENESLKVCQRVVRQLV